MNKLSLVDCNENKLYDKKKLIKGNATNNIQTGFCGHYNLLTFNGSLKEIRVVLVFYVRK